MHDHATPNIAESHIMGLTWDGFNPIPIPESIPYPLDMGLIWDGSIPYLIPYQSHVSGNGVNLGRTRFFPDSGFFHPVRRSGVIPIAVSTALLCLYAFCSMYSLLREPGRHS